MAHGVSAYTSLRLRSERDPARVSHLLALAAGWARRLRTISAAVAEGTSAVSREQFEGILESRRPYTVAAVGFVGLLVLLYLMLFKPSLGFGGEAEAVSCPKRPAGAVGVCAVSDTAFV